MDGRRQQQLAAPASVPEQQQLAVPPSAPEQPPAPLRADPKAFMLQIKAELPADLMRAVGGMLGRYKEDRATQAFIEGITQLLKGPATVHLLQAGVGGEKAGGDGVRVCRSVVRSGGRVVREAWGGEMCFHNLPLVALHHC